MTPDDNEATLRVYTSRNLMKQKKIREGCGERLFDAQVKMEVKGSILRWGKT